jgi:cobalt-zinc-cadmium efflux system membrane fusion protein
MNTKMLTLLLLGVIAAASSGCDREAPAAGEEAHEESQPEAATGPNGGRLLDDGDFAIELAIFESGVPPEFHAWATSAGQPIAPAEVDLSVELARLGGTVDRIGFAPAGEYLRGDREVSEPHSFDVTVTAAHEGRTHRWTYASYEGRTSIPADVAREAGVATAVAGPGGIVETLILYGSIVPDPTRVREVKARFPGVIRDVQARIGDRVQAGAALATVESNESLQRYAVTAPIAGTVTSRHAEPGEQAGDEELFELADYSSVWVELNVFARERTRVREGQVARITTEGGTEASGAIDYLAPAGERGSQSSIARVVLDNAQGGWVPGQFVEALVTVAETTVDIAVPLSALQTFRDFDVVFARVGDTYEVRMLTLGRRDAERAEVLGGLAPGTEYVTENSYLIKADIEKAGASHDH